jgi:hypothetical protein
MILAIGFRVKGKRGTQNARLMKLSKRNKEDLSELKLLKKRYRS